jgi:hypothetical protein
VSRWATAFHTIYGCHGRDTVDSVDTVAVSDAASPSHCVNRVNSVTPIEDISQEAVPPVAVDPGGTGGGPPPPRPDITLPTISAADLVGQMAEAMAANPVYRITNRGAAMAYFRGVALNRLAASS